MPPSEVSGAAAELGALEDITMTCLAKRPDERFASMDDLVAAIDRVVQLDGDADTDLGPRLASGTDRVSRSVRPPVQDPIEPPGCAEMRVAIDGSGPSPFRRRTPWLYVLCIGAIGGLVLASVGVMRLLSRGLSAAPPPAPVPAAAQPDPPSRQVPSADPRSASGPGPAVSCAPIVGERIPDPTKPSTPSRRHLPPRGELDDVGDPFAAKP